MRCLICPCRISIANIDRASVTYDISSLCTKSTSRKENHFFIQLPCCLSPVVSSRLLNDVLCCWKMVSCFQLCSYLILCLVGYCTSMLICGIACALWTGMWYSMVFGWHYIDVKFQPGWRCTCLEFVEALFGSFWFFVWYLRSHVSISQPLLFLLLLNFTGMQWYCSCSLCRVYLMMLNNLSEQWGHIVAWNAAGSVVVLCDVRLA